MSGTDHHNLRLHIGGTEPREGWKILNIQPGPGVDFVGSCADLSMFSENSVVEIYASHVYEHLDYTEGLPRALKEAHRVLKPGGLLRIGVPDFEMLCRMFIQARQSLTDRFAIQRMIMGGQVDEHDYHKVGLSFDILHKFLEMAGFKSIRRVDQFDLFKDATLVVFGGQPISLNVMAIK